MDALAEAITCRSAKADIVFLVDSSRSICGSDSTCENWRTIRQFVNRVIDQMNIGDDAMRIGFIRYSSASETSNEFYLNSYQSALGITTDVSGVQYQTGRSFIGNLATALSQARREQFTSTRGDRIDAPNVIIVLTNGGFSPTGTIVSFQFLFIQLLVQMCTYVFSSVVHTLFCNIVAVF